MDKERIQKIRDSKEQSRLRQWMNFQETGETKYDTRARAYEELVDICDLALAAADDHYKKVRFQAYLVELAMKADRLLHAGVDEDAAKAFLRNTVVAGELAGYSSVYKEEWK